AVGLHHDPTAAARVLDDVLADLGQRHREANRRLCIETELAKHQLRLLLDAANDIVNILAPRDTRDLEQHVAVGTAGTLRVVAMQLVELFRMTKESRARPVRRSLVQLGYGERRHFCACLREGKECRESERRRPAYVTRIEQHFRIARYPRQLTQDLVEGVIV